MIDPAGNRYRWAGESDEVPIPEKAPVNKPVEKKEPEPRYERRGLLGTIATKVRQVGEMIHTLRQDPQVVMMFGYIVDVEKNMAHPLTQKEAASNFARTMFIMPPGTQKEWINIRLVSEGQSLFEACFESKIYEHFKPLSRLFWESLVFSVTKDEAREEAFANFYTRFYELSEEDQSRYLEAGIVKDSQFPLEYCVKYSGLWQEIIDRTSE